MPFDLTANLLLQAGQATNVIRDLQNQLQRIGPVNVNVRLSNSTLSTLRSLNTILGTVRTSASSASAALSQISTASTAIGSSLRGMSGAAQSLGTAMNKSSGHISTATKSSVALSKSMHDVGVEAGITARRFAAFAVVTSTMYSLTGAIHAAVSEAIEFDDQMVKLEQITGASQTTVNELSNEIIRLSTSLGVSSKELTGVANTLAQAGLTVGETKTALEAIARTDLAATFEGMQDTVEASIAVMAQFGKETSDLESVFSSINKVSAQYAIEASDITTAVKRAGSTVAAAGGSFDEFQALLTSVRSTTRESAETISTGFRTIFTRLQRPKTIEFFRDLGVELQDAEGNFIGVFDAIARISAAVQGLPTTNVQFARIAEEIGGFRQVNKVIPLLKEFKISQEALSVAMASQNSLFIDSEIRQKSIARQIQKVREQFIALFVELSNNEALKTFGTTLLSIANGTLQLTRYLSDLIPLLATLATVSFGKSVFPALAGGVGSFLFGKGAQKGVTQASQGLARPATGLGGVNKAVLGGVAVSGVAGILSALTNFEGAVGGVTQTVALLGTAVTFAISKISNAKKLDIDAAVFRSGRYGRVSSVRNKYRDSYGNADSSSLGLYGTNEERLLGGRDLAFAGVDRGTRQRRLQQRQNLIARRRAGVFGTAGGVVTTAVGAGISAFSSPTSTGSAVGFGVQTAGFAASIAALIPGVNLLGVAIAAVVTGLGAFGLSLSSVFEARDTEEFKKRNEDNARGLDQFSKGVIGADTYLNRYSDNIRKNLAASSGISPEARRERLADEIQNLPQYQAILNARVGELSDPAIRAARANAAPGQLVDVAKIRLDALSSSTDAATDSLINYIAVLSGQTIKQVIDSAQAEVDARDSLISAIHSAEEAFNEFNNQLSIVGNAPEEAAFRAGIGGRGVSDSIASALRNKNSAQVIKLTTDAGLLTSEQASTFASVSEGVRQLPSVLAGLGATPTALSTDNSTLESNLREGLSKFGPIFTDVVLGNLKELQNKDSGVSKLAEQFRNTSDLADALTADFKDMEASLEKAAASFDGYIEDFRQRAEDAFQLLSSSIENSLVATDLESQRLSLLYGGDNQPFASNAATIERNRFLRRAEARGIDANVAANPEALAQQITDNQAQINALNARGNLQTVEEIKLVQELTLANSNLMDTLKEGADRSRELSAIEARRSQELSKQQKLQDLAIGVAFGTREEKRALAAQFGAVAAVSNVGVNNVTESTRQNALRLAERFSDTRLSIFGSTGAKDESGREIFKTGREFLLQSARDSFREFAVAIADREGLAGKERDDRINEILDDAVQPNQTVIDELTTKMSNVLVEAQKYAQTAANVFKDQFDSSVQKLDESFQAFTRGLFDYLSEQRASIYDEKREAAEASVKATEASLANVQSFATQTGTSGGADTVRRARSIVAGQELYKQNIQAQRRVESLTSLTYDKSRNSEFNTQYSNIDSNLRSLGITSEGVLGTKEISTLEELGFKGDDLRQIKSRAELLRLVLNQSNALLNEAKQKKERLNRDLITTGTDPSIYERPDAKEIVGQAREVTQTTEDLQRERDRQKAVAEENLLRAKKARRPREPVPQAGGAAPFQNDGIRFNSGAFVAPPQSPNAPGIPSLPQVAGAIPASTDISRAMNSFNQDLNRFATKVDEIGKNFPKEITGNFTFTPIQIVHNGAEFFSQLEPRVASLVESKVASAIDGLMKANPGMKGTA